MSTTAESQALPILERYFDTHIESSQLQSWGTESGDGVTLITVAYGASETQAYVCLIDIIDDSNKALVRAIPVKPDIKFTSIEF